MADEKKPKIDLKARLGKSAVGGANPPPGAGAIPAPAATPTPNGGGAPGAIATPGNAAKLPVPPGIPVGPPPAFKSPGVALDPSNPLAAAMAPAGASARPAPAKAQRIEVDELTVQEARKGARKQGLVAGLVAAVVVGAIGYIIGGAHETSKGRAQSVAHAKSLAEDVNKSREQLKKLAEVLDAGRKSLAEKKYPESLAKDLGGINVDFDGGKLAGVRFSGFTHETTTGLIEYISAIQSTNDRKNALIGLLGRVQKPLSEQMKDPNKAPSIQYVVLLKRDSARNPYGVLAPLQKPIELSANMPETFEAIDPTAGRQNVSAPKFTSLDKPGAAYVVPKSIEAAFPSELSGQVGQVVGQLARLTTDIRGEGGGQAGDALVEPKPGLLDRADRLVTNLNKVQ
jgi:hypothetical protein